MVLRICIVLSFLIFRFETFAQFQNNSSSSNILLELQKLNSLGKVLYVAAHPDDENTRLLTYLANEKKCLTAYLSITRGDGGQNLIGKEQGEVLGVLRTQELLAARRVDGALQYFTRAVDFGYSKNPEETFEVWNKERTLGDVVYIIRSFKPDVIICRFPTTGEGGHGHHTASAILAQEAFEAAADPNRFPEQVKALGTWSSTSLFWNTFNFSSGNTTSPDQVQIDVGGYNPLLGKSYGEIASESRSCHKSQGFGVPRQRGKNLEFFKQLKGDTGKKDLFAGMVHSWADIPGAEAIQIEIENCIRNYQAAHPENSVPALLRIFKCLQIQSRDDEKLKYWKTQKRKDIEKLILDCSGIWLEASVPDYRIVPGQEIHISAQIISRTKVPVRLRSISYFQTDSTCDLLLQQNNLYTFKHKEQVRESQQYSSPYWLQAEEETQLFEGKAEKSHGNSVKFLINLEEVDLVVERPLIHKFTDPVRGEIYRPVEILPPATIGCKEQAFVFANGADKIITLSLKANTSALKAKVELVCTKGWTAELNQSEIFLDKEGDEILVEALIRCEKAAAQGTLSANLIIGDKRFNQSIQRIDYDHIPSQFILRKASYTLENVSLLSKKLKVAYVEGAGDEIPLALKQSGLVCDQIKAEDLPRINLSAYDAVVTGIRAYNTDKVLLQNNALLLDYVKQGGNLLVQYNTNNNIGQLKSRIGPFPFTISRERVTNEKSKVNFLLPKHPALNYPNKLDSTDFENWIQERGIYFATETDPNYSCPLGMNDPEEKEKNGGLIIAPYGKGNYIYTGLAFFRQLPAGVPGAYRLFVNLLNLPKH